MERRLRPSALDAARRAGVRQAQQQVQRLSSPSGSTVVGILLAVESEPTWRAEVDVLGNTLWLGATPGGYVRGGSVYVLTDSQARPYWVSGPTGVPVPDSLVPTTPGGGAVPVVVQPDLSIDPGARARNEEVAGELVDARGRIESAQGLIEAVRERVGRKAWAGETFTSPQGTFKWTPLGGGVVRFESAYPDNEIHTWGPAPRPPEPFEGASVDVTFPGPGEWGIEYETANSDYHFEYATVTVTSEMMGPDYGWVDMEIALDDLMAPGGPLDPVVVSELWEQVVAAGFLVATEAIIGPAALIDGAVTARTLNVLHELPNGAALSVQPDGIRMWQAGNDPQSGQPNVTITTGDGFRVQDDAGNGLLWIDPATGDLNTAGAVVSGGVITGSTLDVPGVFSAVPGVGVTVGGLAAIYSRSSFNTSSTYVQLTQGNVPVTPGESYRVYLDIERLSLQAEADQQIEIEWHAGAVSVGTEVILPWFGATYGAPRWASANVEPPAGVNGMRVYLRQTDSIQVRITNLAVSTTARGDVHVDGDVTGLTGEFNNMLTGSIQGLGGEPWNPVSSGWRDITPVAGWGSGTIRARRWAGWVIVTYSIARGSVATGDWRNLCVLPESLRPDIEIYEGAVSNSDGGTAVQSRALPTGGVQLSFPPTLSDTSTIRGSLTWPR